MKLGWKLSANLLAWIAAFPLINAAARMLERRWEWAGSSAAAGTVAVVLLLWAGLIYWLLVPRGTTAAKRAGYLAAFALLMLASGLLSMWLGFWLSVGLYGL
ncbi:hypothetical protein WKW79_02090 [Variovorax robiniae]|uniref:Uncharacterized protein n=1 Tax=Variovorax robiniae TaxID=1836199 RepID=A0ABU8X2H0_9BURK